LAIKNGSNFVPIFPTVIGDIFTDSPIHDFHYMELFTRNKKSLKRTFVRLLIVIVVFGCVCFLVVHHRWYHQQSRSFHVTTLQDELSLTMKIAIYMTTHQSEEHLLFLSQCWPKASHTLRLLRNADLIYYTGTELIDIPYHIFATMGFRKVIVYRHVKSSYQLGAKRAMVDPFFKPQWFHSYDWIIRLNPDVLIRNDTWLIAQMLNTSAQAIVVSSDGVMHSDFVAFRPSLYQLPHITEQQLQDQLHDKSRTAEQLVSFLLMPLKCNNTISFVPDVIIKDGGARVLGRNSPVIHSHSLLKFCPDYFDATDGEWY
jgi:hypothetical protein